MFNSLISNVLNLNSDKTQSYYYTEVPGYIFNKNPKREEVVDVRLLLAECLDQSFHFFSLPGNARETKTALFGMTVYTWSPPLLS